MCYATYNKIDILFKINDNDPQLISQVASFLQTKRFLTLIDGTYCTQPAAPHSSSRIDKLGSCLLVQLSNKPYPKVATLSCVMTWGSCEILWRKPAHFQIPLNWGLLG